ncbi:MAG: dihydrolipoamide acetyltransferase family protein [Solirubrobacterales bacterium]
MPEIVMPRLSDSMEEGTIVRWLKSEGEEVALGEELVEIETDKANMAYEADVAGTLTKILAAAGDTLAIGEPIAVVGDPGEGSERSTAGPVEEESPAGGGAAPFSDSPPRHPQAGGGDGSAEAPAAPVGAPSPQAGEAAGERVKASPLARRLARERGVELAQLQGSGPGGRIVKADVEQAAAAGTGGLATSTRQEEAVSPPVPSSTSGGGQTAKGEVTLEEPNRLQQVVARRMSEAKATAPHFYLTTEIEMTKAVEARKALKARAKEGEVVPSFNDMVVKACAIALRELPKANGAYKDGRFELYSRVNVGVAVAAPGALVVPTIFDADQKGLRQIAAEARELAGKVRDAKITPPELSGATFTVSNLGMYGITEFEAVINLPQAAILAVGAIQERPLFKDGELVPAQLMKATISCDHRILYGAEGAELLARIRALLEEPLSLAL